MIASTKQKSLIAAAAFGGVAIAFLLANSCGRLEIARNDGAKSTATPGDATPATGDDPGKDSEISGDGTGVASGSGSASGSASASAAASSEPLAREKAAFAACAASGKAANLPAAQLQSIEALIAFINALPRPLSVECFLAALPRPLPLTAAHSPASAQQSPDYDTPRLFVKYGNFFITANSEAFDADTVEVSELQTNGKSSVKGEVYFPVIGPAKLTLADAYNHLLALPGRSQCSICHQNEKAAGGPYPAAAFTSEAIRPNDGYLANAAKIKKIAADCGDQATGRCARLRAIFYGGDPQPFTFPAAMSFRP